MKFRNTAYNSLIFLVSIYTPLFLYSIFWTFKTNTLKFSSSKILNIQNKNARVKKIKAIKDGFLPFYHPTFSKKHGLEYSIYPIGSLPNSNSYYCDEGFGLIKYRTDRFGLRNADEKWNKISNQSNIFVLGDSFAHGACVDNQSTIPANIYKKSGINTVNLASGGNGPYEYIALMKSIIDPIIKESTEENWVVIVFYYNDNVNPDIHSQKLLNKTNSIVSFKPNGDLYPSINYKKKVKELITKHFPTSEIELINSTNNKIDWKSSGLYPNITLMPVLARLNEMQKAFSSKVNLPNPSNQAINLISDICINRCKPIISYIPYSSFWDPTPEERDLTYKNQLKDLALKLNITFIDGSKVIDRNNLHDYASKGTHLSPNGYKKIGNLIGSEIKN